MSESFFLAGGEALALALERARAVALEVGAGAGVGAGAETESRADAEAHIRAEAGTGTVARAEARTESCGGIEARVDVGAEACTVAGAGVRAGTDACPGAKAETQSRAGTEAAGAGSEACESVARAGAETPAEAQAASGANAVALVDAAYARVLDLVPSGDTALWSTLAAEHISVLRSAGRLTPAAARCEQYLRDHRALAHPLPLLLERAQLRSESGAHAAAASDAAEIRRVAGAELDTVDQARLRRVEGLAAAADGDRAGADRFLNEARELFQSIGDDAAAAVIDADLNLVAMRDGADQASAALPEPTSAPRALARAQVLKTQHRYEEALQVIVTALASGHLDEALRLPFLEELVGLLIALRRGKALKALSAELPQTLLRAGGPAEGTGPPAVRFLSTLLNTLRLLERGEVERARLDLDAIRAFAASDRDRAHWHLASGEVWIATFKRRKEGTALAEAVRDLNAALDLAHPARAENHLELRIRALRLLGEAFELRNEPDSASERWAEAHALEEDLVARQVSDEIRATLLDDIPTEHDERIRVTAELAASGPGGASAATAVASAIVAMESARGAAILSRIAPDADAALRRLPPPADGAAAWAWLRGIADATARDEAVWIMHARPDRIHHGLIARGLAHHVDLPADRGGLEKLVKELRKQCNEFRLSQPEGRAQVSRLIEQLASAIGVETVLRLVPRRIKRLIVVAGGVLSDIPLAALPFKGEPDAEAAPIVCRFALSDLPCLSARPLLRQRSAGNRGGRALLVSAFAAADQPANSLRRRKVLTEATPEDFEGELQRTDYRRVRILGHGQTDPADASQTWLQFAAGAGRTLRADRVQPTRFQKAALQACGTLILGACESGMAQRVGRDERTGFVRAGLLAGAASVVAARWIAEVSVTAALLDRFERYLRYLPRDVALQRAQLDVRNRRLKLAADVPEPDHPAWWACWTLYGDSGHQAKAPILRASVCQPAMLIRRLFRTS